jgi:hypothetical protein
MSKRRIFSKMSFVEGMLLVYTYHKGDYKIKRELMLKNEV